MDYHKLEKRIEEYVTGLFEQMQSPALTFHNLDHTKNVVKRTKEIAGHYNISEKETLILFAAAWFHDTGHLFTDPKQHEEMSVDIMRKFMKDQSNDEALIHEIEGCILSTKPPRNPKTLLQEIICDADTYHLGTKDFKANNKNAIEEVRLRSANFNKNEFTQKTIAMLEEHQFYTNYCKELLNEKKNRNLNKLIQKTRNKKDKEAENANLADLEKDKSGLMGKGIQTMLRLTSQNHLRLSEMADHKANILISVNSIIISVILSVLLRKLSEDTYLIIPTIIFLVVAVVTIVISILATRPKIDSGSFTIQDVKEKKINLLFFGNFYKTTYEQYNAAMREMMVDTDYLYGSLIKDIYYLGAVLGRKYKLIRIAYNVFMIGIVVSVLAFGIAALFGGNSMGNVINGTGSPL
jgi:HD-GYP domain-containing protein (c-di-GMP phosphodiesterase class II)